MSSHTYYASSYEGRSSETIENLATQTAMIKTQPQQHRHVTCCANNASICMGLLECAGGSSKPKSKRKATYYRDLTQKASRSRDSTVKRKTLTR